MHTPIIEHGQDHHRSGVPDDCPWQLPSVLQFFHDLFDVEPRCTVDDFSLDHKHSVSCEQTAQYVIRSNSARFVPMDLLGGNRLALGSFSAELHQKSVFGRIFVEASQDACGTEP